jgi:hypothetical protein
MKSVIEGDFYNRQNRGTKKITKSRQKPRISTEVENDYYDYNEQFSPSDSKRPTKPYVPLHMSTREQKKVFEKINNPNWIPRSLNSKTTASLTGRLYTTREANRSHTSFASVKPVTCKFYLDVCSNIAQDRPTSRHSDIVYSCLKTMDYSNREFDTRYRLSSSTQGNSKSKRPTTEPAFDHSRKLDNLQVAGFKINHGVRVETNPSNNDLRRLRGQKPMTPPSHHVCMTVHASRHNIDDPSNLGRNVPVWPL